MYRDSLRPRWSGYYSARIGADLSIVFDPFLGPSGTFRALQTSDFNAKVVTVSNYVSSGVNGDCLLANPNRTKFGIQNLQTGALYVKFGTTASFDSFNIVLKADSTARAGAGGLYTDDNYTGIVSVSGQTGPSPLYIAWETTKTPHA